MIPIKGKRRRGNLTERSLGQYEESMSSYCLASKMKRCRAFDLEQGEEEDEDESCQMEAKKKNSRY